MGTLVDTDRLALYDQTGVAPYINDFQSKKVTSTVSGNTVSFTDDKIQSNVIHPIIDGPYISNVMVSVTGASVSNNTVTFTLDSELANGQTAYIWLRF